MIHALLIIVASFLMGQEVDGNTWYGKWIQAQDCENTANTWQAFRKTVETKKNVAGSKAGKGLRKGIYIVGKKKVSVK